jgi:Clostripain family.
MKRIFFAYIVLFLSLVACCKDDDPEQLTDQTLFMYMPWSTNLTSYFERNIEDIEKAIREKGIEKERVLVYFMSSSTEATLFELTSENGNSIRTILMSYSNPVFTTANGITSIIKDVISFAPAKRYAMIIGGHGMGWLPVESDSDDVSPRSYQKKHWEYENVPLTRYFGGATAEYQTDISALAEGILNSGIKMEYILFDDCYMSSIEVAYELKNVTDYLIASPTEIMAHGFPYDIIGEFLIGDVNYQAISDSFYEFYQNYTIMPCGTIGIVKCSELEGLAVVMKEINQKFDFDPLLLDSVQRLDGYSPVIFFDFGDYVTKLCADPVLLQKFKISLEQAIPPQLKKNTPYYYSMSGGRQKINTFSGVTISDPSLNVKADGKITTSWYRATN